MKLTLTDRHPETSDVTTFIFTPDAPVSWKAGQFLEYHLPHPDKDDRGDVRWFTISAPPFEQHPQITTRFTAQKGSSFKRALKDLAIGDTIEVKTPEGEFVIENPDAHYVFVAGGIGITPFRSILQQADHDGLRLNVDLLYANRSDEFVFKGELDELAARNPKLKLHYIVAPQRIDEQLLAEYNQKDPKAIFYVSGPEPMVEALDATLKGIGVPEERITNDFFPGYPAE